MEEATGPRSFARLIENLGGGDLLADLSDQHHELTQEMYKLANQSDSRVEGELSFTLKQTVDHKGNVGAKWDIKIKKPTKKRVPAMAFLDKRGHIVFQSPRQAELPNLREVTPPRTYRDVDAAANEED